MIVSPLCGTQMKDMKKTRGRELDNKATEREIVKCVGILTEGDLYELQ